MQKAPVLKGSGLMPLTDDKSSNAEEVHVFGRNLEERVVNNDNSEAPSISFSTVEGNQSSEDDIDSIRKRKFDAITGEEDEDTIFQGDFKLFVWDKSTSNWIEKGRGQLKLNDTINQNEKRSRLIMRVNGTLRILLNVSIRRSYFRVITNSKTHIRFTDSQTVWAASGSNASQLKDLIEERQRMTPEEENELRKKAKSDSSQQTQQPVTTTSSSTTRATESEEPTAPTTSEIQSNQDDTTNNSISSSDDIRSRKCTEDEIIVKSSYKKEDGGKDVNGGDTARSVEAASSKNEEKSSKESKSAVKTTLEKKPEVEKETSSQEEEVKKVSDIATVAKQTTNGELKVAKEGGDKS